MTGEELPSTVEYVQLGKSGLRVSKVVLGCMSYGNKGWADWIIEDEAEAMSHFKAAWDAGINTWDTANVYSNGDSERLVGLALRKLQIPREEIVILTKAHMVVQKVPTAHPSTLKDPNTRDYVNAHGNSRKNLFAAVKASLERMQIEYIDLLQLHRWDYATPIEETMDALHDLVKLGLIRYIGMSSCYAYQLHAAQAYAKAKGQTQFISLQPFYTSVYREEERESFPTCELFGMGVLPWSPLGRGFLTRPWREQDAAKGAEENDDKEKASSRQQTDPNYGRFLGLGTPEEGMLREINEAIEKIAKDRGYSMAQITLAWVLSNRHITAPIIGSTRVSSIIEAVQATHIKLSEEEVQAINAPYRPRNILGHS